MQKENKNKNIDAKKKINKSQENAKQQEHPQNQQKEDKNERDNYEIEDDRTADAEGHEEVQEKNKQEHRNID